MLKKWLLCIISLPKTSIMCMPLYYFEGWNFDLLTNWRHLIFIFSTIMTIMYKYSSDMTENHQFAHNVWRYTTQSYFRSGLKFFEYARPVLDNHHLELWRLFFVFYFAQSTLPAVRMTLLHVSGWIMLLTNNLY